jgi:hypothetical protein
MQLRGKPINPQERNRRRLKLFVYGAAGTGKSYFCTQFGKSYYVDTEKSIAGNSKYEQNIYTNGGSLFETRNFTELFKEVYTLASVKHDFQTLVIDPITPIYNNLLDSCLTALNKTNRKQGYGQHYQEANKQFQRLIELLLKIDMNVIITAHSKDKYGPEMNVIGTTFDAYKKFDFLFDVILETQIQGNQYTAISRKSRLVSLEPNQVINFSFSEFSSLYKKELESFVSTPLAGESPSPPSLSIVNDMKIEQETLNHLVYLIQATEASNELKQKWLDYFEVKTFRDLSEKDALKLIAKIEKNYPDEVQAWQEILEARKSEWWEKNEGEE